MTRFTGAGNKQATQNALQNDFALVGNFSLEDSFGGTVLAQNPGFPDVSQVLDDATSKLPNVFSPIPLADGWSSGPMEYYKQTFKPLAHYAGAFWWPTPRRPPRRGTVRSTWPSRPATSSFPSRPTPPPRPTSPSR